MILGICGGSGAGKTTLLNRLAAHFHDIGPAVFSMDNYYLPLEQQHRDQSGEVNFDLPTALDRERMARDLRALASGKTVQLNEYRFNTGPDECSMLTIRPSKLIIVEGLFLFHYVEIAALMNFAVFIDIDARIQLARRLQRDQQLRGCSEQLIRYQWDNHVAPCFDEFLLPYRHKADFFFRNEDQVDQEFDRLITALNTLIT